MSGHRLALLIFAFALTTSLIGGIGYQRHRNYLALAEHHLAEMAAFQSLDRSDGHTADMIEGKVPREPILAFLMPVDDTSGLRARERLSARRADHHAAMSWKYRKAAERPWISVEPDPPSP